MDNPTRWNITNSAQNIVSALVDPSKQFDSVFRREWANTFANFNPPKQAARPKQDADLKAKLTEYINQLEKRKHIKAYEAQRQAKSQQLASSIKEHQDKIVVPEIFFKDDFDLSNLDTFNKVIASTKERDQTTTSDDDVHQVYYQQQYRNHQRPPILTKAQLKELQQNFTDYLDTIEDKLASQISNRSGDFFQVMSSVDSVMDELSLAIKSVTSLRKKCFKLNDTLIVPNMKIIHLNRTRDNAQIVLDKMNEIAYLYKIQPKLLADDFDNLSELVDSIANGFSEISERNSLTLSSLLQIQAEKFVNKFHEERKRKLEVILDEEQWKTMEDVPPEFQRLVSMLVDENRSISETIPMSLYYPSRSVTLSTPSSVLKHSKTSSDTAMTAVAEISDVQQQIADTVSSASGSSSKQQLTGTKKRQQQQPKQQVVLPNNGRINFVAVDGTTYVVVRSLMYLIRTIMDYCKCAHDIRSLSADLLERLFKILQLYNSKTYHLVYKAEAVKVAGLKSITTRSLVVSQQSLKLITLLLPAIHKHFSQLLPDSNRLRRFDEIKLSYEDHAAKIPERINSIVRDVIDLQLKDWEAKPPVPSAQFNAITQHLMRLHDNIVDALPADELRVLFLRINETFREVLLSHLRRLNINNDAGPKQWLVTQELTYYKISLAKLGVFKVSELNFDHIWSC